MCRGHGTRVAVGLGLCLIHMNCGAKGFPPAWGLPTGLCSAVLQSTSGLLGLWGSPIGFSRALHGQKVVFAISLLDPVGWVWPNLWIGGAVGHRCRSVNGLKWTIGWVGGSLV